MATSIATLAVNVVAHTGGLRTGLGSARGDIASFAVSVSRTAGSVLGLQSALASLAAGAAVKGIISLTAEAEQMQVAFGVLLKSSSDAQMLLDQLKTFAAETPLELPEITTSAKQLIAYGVAQRDILGTMQRLGDVSSALAIPLEDMTYLFGTARVQGRLFTRDLNQFTNRGVPIITELAKNLGVSTAQIMAMTEAGRIGFPELEEAFITMTAEGGQFHGMMEAQAKTLSGQWSKLKDEVKALGRDIGTEILPQLKSMVAFSQDAVKTFRELRGLSPEEGPDVKEFQRSRRPGTHISFFQERLEANRKAQQELLADTRRRSQKTFLGLEDWLMIKENSVALEGMRHEAEFLRDRLNQLGAAAKRAGNDGAALADVARINDEFGNFGQEIKPNALADGLGALSNIVPRIANAFSEMADSGKAMQKMFDDTRTPIEKFERDMAKLIQLKESLGDLMPFDLVERKAKQLRETLISATKTDSPAALERGTAEAFSATRGNNRDALKKIDKNTADALKKADEQVRELREIKRELRDAPGLAEAVF